MEKGRSGERYILAGENVTVKQLFDLIADLTGLTAPTIKSPVGVLRVLAALMEFAAELTGRRPMIDRSQVDEFAGKYAYFDSAKADRELGYTFLSARDTLRRTVAWIVERRLRHRAAPPGDEVGSVRSERVLRGEEHPRAFHQRHRVL